MKRTSGLHRVLSLRPPRSLPSLVPRRITASERRAARALEGLLRVGSARPDALDELGGADWNELAVLVRRHGLGGLTARRLTALNGRPPESAREVLQASAQRALFTGLRAQNTLRRAVEILAAGGVGPIAPLKGAQLLATLYPTPGARSTTDVDLLIPHAMRERAHRALQRAGYRYIPKPPGRPASQEQNYERSYVGPEGVLIDVHAAICQPERAELDYPAMLLRAERAGLIHPWAPGAVQLDVEDTLLTLAVHMAQDCFAGPFRQIVDIAWWLHAASPDLAVAAQRAHNAGASTVLWLALRLARQRLDAPVPEVALRLVRPSNELRRRYLTWVTDGEGLTAYRYDHSKRYAQLLTLYPLLDSPHQGLWLTMNYGWLRAQDAWSSSRDTDTDTATGG